MQKWLKEGYPENNDKVDNSWDDVNWQNSPRHGSEDESGDEDDIRDGEEDEDEAPEIRTPSGKK